MTLNKEDVERAQKFMSDLWSHIDDYMLATAGYDYALCAGSNQAENDAAERNWYVQRRKLRDFIGLEPETEVPGYPDADYTVKCDANGIAEK